MLLLATKGVKQWLVSLICRDPAQASGACHRSLQLLHLLEDDGWQLQPVQPPGPPASRWATLGYGMAAAFRHGPLQPVGIESLRSQGHCARQVALLHRQFPGLTGVIIEGTGYGSLSAVAEWRRRGVRTVLVPANIEALAPNTGSWTHRGLDVSQRFAHERRWWAMADAIFTISIEEAWWLQLHGIAAEHLPYYPSGEHLDRLLAIRASRVGLEKHGYLWLADFTNPANQKAASLALDWIKANQTLRHPVVVVGRGVEWLQSHFDSQDLCYLEIIGAVSGARLMELQKVCVAYILVHPPTSGILTRVVDAAIAGIPVVGNQMALKSYWTLFAKTANENSSAIKADEQAPIDPGFPRQASTALLSRINSW